MRKTLKALLQEGDPLAHEPAMAPEDVDRMHRLVVASEHQAPPRSWTMRVAYASAFAAVIGVSAWLNHETTKRDSTAVAQDIRSPGPSAFADASADSPEPWQRRSGPGVRGERRQLQFATPGGTRVIWVFDSDFDMR